MGSSFSIVICSIDPWKFAQTCACYKRRLAGTKFEIIGIHDARSLAEGYGRGLARARGDTVIFSHDDVIFLDRQFAQKISERMTQWDILGFAGATHLTHPAWFAAGYPHLRGAVCHWSRRQANVLSLMIYGTDHWPVASGMEVLDGLCMIARHEVATSVGFDDDTFDGWHLYDCDFSFAAHLAGYSIGVCCDIPYIHASASVQSGESTYDTGDYGQYAERFARKYAHERHLPTTGVKSAPGTQCYVPDHDTLLTLWTEEVFRRAQISIDRQMEAA